ncbi:MAG: isochorismatase family protein [Desulfobacterales bacterium]|jgi:nicotinamidase-related amidase|nr:isochorismatase family protein [Desulfobacterales bacterium]
MLQTTDTLLLIVDIQEKLFRSIHAKEELLANAQKLARGAGVLGIPLVWAEQNPRGLGPTVPELAALLTAAAPISKFSFSCCESQECMRALRASGRRSVLISGIEAHICVYQTAAGLAAAGFAVEVVADACSSRTPENKRIGIEKCRAAGAGITSVETALFELLKVAEGPVFKEILNIVK